MLYKYSNFKENIFLEKLINESIIYYSPDVRKILSKLSNSNSIAKDILSIETEDIKPDITFVDLDKEGYLSFSTMRNAKKNITDKFSHLDYIDTKVDVDLADELWSLDKRGSERATGVYSKSRNQVAIGKFVNKLFPNKYSDKEREEFVNSFKAAIENSGEKFKVVEGEDIAYWYNKDNYKEKAGTLGNSCMADKPGYYFNIYVKNPEICKMLILVEDDKLIARALLWKVTSYRSLSRDWQGPEWFMDRQYTIKDSDVQKLRKYADEKGWAYKTNNNHHSFNSITISGETKNVEMKVQLKKIGTTYEYGKYPYMDTFRRFDVNRGILHNDDQDDNEGNYLLDDTSGGYTETNAGVYSEWHGENIPENRAVWSDYADSYLWDNRAVEVTRGSRIHRGYYPEDHDDIVYDDWIDEYLHIDDSVYSENYGHSLYVDTAVKVISDVYSDGECEDYDSADWYHEDDDNIIFMDSNLRDKKWFKGVSSKFSEWNEFNYIKKSQLVKDYQGDWILKKLQIDTYKVLGPNFEKDEINLKSVEYLSEVDSYILGYELDMDERRLTDKFEYQQDISDISSILEQRLSKRVRYLNNILIGEVDDELPLKYDDESIEETKEKARKELNKISSRLEELENETYS